MKWLKSMFNDPQGETSSKRVLGVSTIICGIVMGFMGNQQGILFVTGGGALLAVNGITKT